MKQLKDQTEAVQRERDSALKECEACRAELQQKQTKVDAAQRQAQVEFIFEICDILFSDKFVVFCRMQQKSVDSYGINYGTSSKAMRTSRGEMLASILRR